MHQGSVDRGGIAGSEWHNGEAVFSVVGGKKGKFFLVTVPDMNLVVSSSGIKGDEEEVTVVIAKVVNGIITARDGVCEGQSDGVELAVADTHAPNKFIDVLNMFLVGFWCKHHHAAPGATALFDPVVVK